MSQFWVVKNISAQAYNANAGVYILGVPQPTAISGWIHAFMRAIAKKSGLDISGDTRFVYAVEHYSGPSGISLSTRTAAGTAAAKKATPAAIVDRAKAHLVFSVIIEWIPGQDDSSASTMLARSKIKEAIEQTRLMGASLFLESSEQIMLENDLQSALRKLGASSFILSDASLNLEQAIEEERLENPDSGVVEALAVLLARPIDGSYKPRYVPVISGYQALKSVVRKDGELESPRNPQEKNNEGTAFEHPSPTAEDFRARHEQYSHHYVEPIISAGLFQSRASALKAERLGKFQGMWRLQESKEDGLWVLSGRGAEEDEQDDGDDDDFFI